ncbi:MAG TPA: transaldolase family protein, partial [Candidatus Binatus sp.]|nr:transaldolase family protein [Candidatus Binatus sp.]
VGRLDDINEEGMTVVRELSEIIRFYEIESEVLTASVRHPRHVTEAALAGSHNATLPFKVFQQLVSHPLTDKGIVQFKKDWEAARKAMAEGSGPR